MNFNSYRSDLNKVGSSDSDSSDSESNQDVWKRCTTKKNSAWPTLLPSENCVQNEGNAENLCESKTSAVGLKRKKNTVWSNILQERSVTEDLTQIGLRAKPILLYDRSCENYDYTLKYEDPREVQECDMEEDVLSDSETNSHKVNCTQSESELVGKSKLRRIELKKRRKDVLDVSKKIIKALNEPKRSLIYKVVETIGCAKAMQILKETETIEENGGMYVKDNSRRRTPGGTYFTLLRNDKSVSKKKKAIIFEEDRKMQEKRFKMQKYTKYSAKRQSADDMQNCSGKEENHTIYKNNETYNPCELVVSKEDSDIEEGEIID